MQEGDTGIVVGHRGVASAARLAELGLTPGEHVHIIRRGSPMLIQIGDSRLCLRSDDAAAIAVLPL